VQADRAWVERYAHRLEQYRLPKAEAKRQDLAWIIHEARDASREPSGMVEV
jgi:hypothetical protein